LELKKDIEKIGTEFAVLLHPNVNAFIILYPKTAQTYPRIAEVGPFALRVFILAAILIYGLPLCNMGTTTGSNPACTLYHLAGFFHTAFHLHL